MPFLGYRGKAVCLAAIAATAPLSALLVGGAPWVGYEVATLPLALAVSAAALFALAGLLQPIPLTAQALELYLSSGVAADLPTGHRDEAGRLMAAASRLARRADSVRASRADRHPLTGLPADDAFLAEVDARLGQSPNGAVLGLIRFGDYGRLAAFDPTAADRALGAFARRLRHVVSADRLVAQVQRDCFAVWFDEIEGREAGAELQAIGYVLAQALPEGEPKLTPEVVLAAAIFPDDGEDAAELFNRALAALPLGAAAGPGKVSFSSPQSAVAARQRFALEQGLRQAVSGDQFELHFQPVVDLEAGALIGAEALLRWRHPELGLVSPGQFIPLLEQSDLMEEAGLWVLNTACREARAFKAKGLDGLKIAVNVSARQLRDGALPSLIERTLTRHALSPESLEIELTETAALEDDRRTRDLLSQLRDLGVSVAIDDFGTGYSSLSKLKNLPFTKLKIDREFVAGVDQSRENQAICGSLLELGRGLGMAVLAEGSESLEEVECLRRLGCSMFQGFFFARPMTADIFDQTVRDPEWLALLTSPVRRERAKLQQRIASR
ncbi:MAG: putative bifunctional diguanylate cyclase/phosphodiesterase [Caulobacteraceae bacterium]